MKLEKYHKKHYDDIQKPVEDYYKKGFWKRYDRKKFFRKEVELDDYYSPKELGKNE